MGRTELKVGPMDCAACSVIIWQSLTQMPGVLRAEVQPSEERVYVQFDDQLVSPGDMVEMLYGRGYRAAILR